MSEELELPDTSPRDARIAAVRLLSRREHSAQEITQKLSRKGFAIELINQLTQNLCDEGLLSDERFAASYTRSRTSGGFGPARIRQELRQRGVSDEIIAATIISDATHWFELAHKVREKRFGDEKPQNLK